MSYKRFRLPQDLQTFDAMEQTEYQLHHLECERIERWHATYNAAVTGELASRSGTIDNSQSRIESAVLMGKIVANATHGPLTVVEVEDGNNE